MISSSRTDLLPFPIIVAIAPVAFFRFVFLRFKPWIVFVCRFRLVRTITLVKIACVSTRCLTVFPAVSFSTRSFTLKRSKNRAEFVVDFGNVPD